MREACARELLINFMCTLFRGVSEEYFRERTHNPNNLFRVWGNAFFINSHEIRKLCKEAAADSHTAMNGYEEGLEEFIEYAEEEGFELILGVSSIDEGIGYNLKSKYGKKLLKETLQA